METTMEDHEERKMNMKKDDHNRNARKERIVMISTSAMVLTVLTVTGAYVRSHHRNSMDNGYTLDFSAMEEHAGDKIKEITQSTKHDPGQTGKEPQNLAKSIPEKDPDIPLRVGSDEIRIPGLTDRDVLNAKPVDQSGSEAMSAGVGMQEKRQEIKKQEVIAEEPEAEPLPPDPALQVFAAPAESPVISEELRFEPASMIKPVSGNPLIAYSMDHGTYFATLDQYKCNPAVIYEAQQGEPVCACTTGRVMNVHNDAELGHVLVMDLGDGYQAIYGQLENIEVPIGGMVEAGMKLASVAAPTKYYCVEGTNLYFQMLKDGKSIDPGQFFQ